MEFKNDKRDHYLVAVSLQAFFPTVLQSAAGLTVPLAFVSKMHFILVTEQL